MTLAIHSLQRLHFGSCNFNFVFIWISTLHFKVLVILIGSPMILTLHKLGKATLTFVLKWHSFTPKLPYLCLFFLCPRDFNSLLHLPLESWLIYFLIFFLDLLGSWLIVNLILSKIPLVLAAYMTPLTWILTSANLVKFFHPNRLFERSQELSP
jgi:hypothetical protein